MDVARSDMIHGPCPCSMATTLSRETLRCAGVSCCLWLFARAHVGGVTGACGGLLESTPSAVRARPALNLDRDGLMAFGMILLRA